MNNKKIVLIGDAGTGKTSIANIFGIGKLGNDISSTIGSTYFCKKIVINKNQEISCEIWDTAGSERYRSLITIYLRHTDIALLVFDLNDRESFKNVERWYETLKNHQSEDDKMRILLIGNKEDLEQDVEESEIKDMVDKYKFDYYQISCYNSQAKEKINKMITENLIKIENQEIKKINKINVETILMMDKKNTFGEKCCY